MVGRGVGCSFDTVASADYNCMYSVSETFARDMPFS